MSSIIKVVKGKVEEIELPEKVDVIVSEPIGFLLVSPRHLLLSFVLFFSVLVCTHVCSRQLVLCVHVHERRPGTKKRNVLLVEVQSLITGANASMSSSLVFFKKSASFSCSRTGFLQWPSPCCIRPSSCACERTRVVRRYLESPAMMRTDPHPAFAPLPLQHKHSPAPVFY